MNFYDFHIHSEFSEGKSSLEEIAKRAKLLGFQGICFAVYYKNRNQIKNLKDKIKEISKKNNIDIFIGLEARTLEELKKLSKIRREFDFLIARGSEVSFNRSAVQTKEVDMLAHPELDRKDSGFNHIMAKLATENDVAIEINFREILLSSKNTRAHIMHKIQENIKLCKKYNTPIVICSGAVTHWQLKDPKVLMSMGCLLGLDLNEAKNAISEVPENMIKMIKDRRVRGWVSPGVKIVK